MNHKCDPFRNRLTRDLVDVREKINPENVEENYLSEEVINTFIRIVISQANSCHGGEKMFTHFSSQTLGQFELHGVAGLYGNGKNEKSKGIIIDRPAQVRLRPSYLHVPTPQSLTLFFTYADRIIVSFFAPLLSTQTIGC